MGWGRGALDKFEAGGRRGGATLEDLVRQGRVPQPQRMQPPSSTCFVIRSLYYYNSGSPPIKSIYITHSDAPR